MASGKQFSLSFLFNAKKAAGFNKTFSSINKSISGVVKGVVGVAAAYVSLNSVKGFITESVEGAKAQLEAETKLEAVLKNVKTIQKKGPEYYKQAKQELMGVASALQGVGVIGDEVTLAGMQQLATFQLDNDQIGKLSNGMVDLLAQQKGLNATQADAVTIANMIGKAMDGNVGALSRVGISFTESQKKALKFGDKTKRAAVIAEILEQNVGGVNEALADTDQGRVQQLTNAWGDMKEEVGKKVLPLYGAFSKIVSSVLPKVQAVLLGVMDKASGAIEKVIEKKDLLVDGFKSGIQRLKDFFSPTFQAIQDAAGKVIDKFKEVKDRIFDMGAAIQDKGKSALDWMGNVGLPKAVELLGKAAEKALEFAAFIKDHWNVILPLIKGVGAAFAGWKIVKTVNGSIKAIKGLASSFKALPAVIAKAAGAEKLANAIKKDGIRFTLQYQAALIKEKIALIAHKVAQLASNAVSTIATGIQWALNAAFVASPLGWIVLGIAAVVAAGIALYKNWDKVKAFAVSLWEKLKSIFGGIGDWFKGVWDGVVNIFTGAWDKIKGVFSGIGDWFKSIWEGVSNIFKGYVNIYINILNFLIRALNKIQVTLPDWVPFGLGGKTLGFSIPEIPLLAQGGIVTGPTLAGIGEGGEPEAVLPLSKLWNMLKGPRTVGGGGIVYSPTIQISGNADRNDIEQALNAGFEQFKKWYYQLMAEQKRVSFSRG